MWYKIVPDILLNRYGCFFLVSKNCIERLQSVLSVSLFVELLQNPWNSFSNCRMVQKMLQQLLLPKIMVEKYEFTRSGV